MNSDPKIEIDFETLKMSMPKLKSQFITPKQAYLARIDDSIIIKFSKKLKICINEDGTWNYLI